MSLFSIDFFIFIFIGCVLYYLIPKKFQWFFLLLLSSYFYASAGLKTLGFILLTTITVWIGAIWIAWVDEKTQKEIKSLNTKQTIEVKKKMKNKAKRKKQIFFWSVLIINVGILAFLKYINFIIGNLNGILTSFQVGELPQFSDLILPLGISFYTFQSLGYLIDVYWGKVKPERNLFKFALFVSFFPQIIQGPIGRYDHLSKQLYSEHKFDIEMLEKAGLLILWGYFKKLVIANRSLFIVNSIFEHPGSYGGALTVFGVLIYSIQQYADFSGGIDIITGIAQIYGIKMAENFKRPYFSQSLSEFWRRWHISLGAWMRDYVFYPLALTKTMSKISKTVKKYLGTTAEKIAPVAIGNVIVFLLVGIWHGPYWHYVIWGLYNGMIIAVSALLEPVFYKMKKVLHINEKSIWFQYFRILRTFLIVNFGWFFDRCPWVKGSFMMIKNVFTNFHISEINKTSLLDFGLTKLDYIVLLLAILLLFVVSVIQEKTGKSVREMILKKPLVIRWVCIYIFIFFTIAFIANVDDTIGGFMYAQF